MAALFQSGHVVDFILGLVLVEALAILIAHRNGLIGLSPREFLATLASGAALLVALRIALSGGPWPLVALALVAALAAHLADLGIRLNSRSTRHRDD